MGEKLFAFQFPTAKWHSSGFKVWFRGRGENFCIGYFTKVLLFSRPNKTVVIIKLTNGKWGKGNFTHLYRGVKNGLKYLRDRVMLTFWCFGL